MTRLNIQQQYILKKALELYKESLNESIEASETLLSNERYKDLKSTFLQSINWCNEMLNETNKLLERLIGEENGIN